MLLVQKNDPVEPARILIDCCSTYALLVDFRSSSSEAVGHKNSLSLSGSNQAREGRLVNALAVRGDERRDTLR